MLQVRLLGELQAEVGGRAVVPPASRRAWSLLAWLALHPGEHPRGAVAARFWPDVLDSSARASLRSAAWALRRALGEDDALIAGRDRIGLRCETDLAAFDAHCAAGELEEAVALHRGPLLADLDEDWVLEARDEHAERLGSALARLAAAAPTRRSRRLRPPPPGAGPARRGGGPRPHAPPGRSRRPGRRRSRPTTASPTACARTSAWPPRPRPARWPRACARASRRRAGRARGAARRAREAARAAHARADGRAARSAATPSRPRSTRSGSGPAPGSGAIALLSGEGGIGKTRLATDCSARADDGAHRARDGGRPRRRRAAVRALGRAARRARPPARPAARRRGWPEELGAARARRCRAGSAARAPTPRTCRPTSPARGCSRPLVELAEHATSDRPLVLLLDDVHLADAPTLELAAYLARRIHDLPVLLVLTRRTIPRRDAVDALVHAARATGVAVERDRARAARRRGRRAPGRPRRARPRRVIAAADGNPLLALESARAREDDRPAGVAARRRARRDRRARRGRPRAPRSSPPSRAATSTAPS